jgi:hypothetical protein
MTDPTTPETPAERLASRLDDLTQIGADLLEVARWLGENWPPALPMPQVAGYQGVEGNALRLQVWSNTHADIVAVARYLALDGGEGAVSLRRDERGPTYVRVWRRWGTVTIEGVIEGAHVEGPILVGSTT